MKHKITSDSRVHFLSLWNDLHRLLAESGERVVKTKVRMTDYNHDYDGYKPRYVAVVWTEKEAK